MNNEFLQNNSTEVLNNPEVINNESNESLEDSTIESREEVENFAEEKIDSLNEEAEEGLEISENEKDAILNLGGDVNEYQNKVEPINDEIESVKNVAKTKILESCQIKEKEVNAEEGYNPNKLGSLLGIGKKELLTFPDKVYRSVQGRAAIDDIEKSGVVRNARSAGVDGGKCKGDSVYWCCGKEGAFSNVQEDCFIIEAPLSVARKRIVRKEDITAIYTKNESGEVYDILK